MTAVEPPRLSTRAAALRLVVGLALAGVVVGGLWAWLAPPIQVIVALSRSSGNRVRGYLGDGSDHVFLGAFLMTGFLTVLAVTAAVGLWQWRAHRGPVMVGALAIGMAGATGVAAGVGAALVRWRYGVVDVASAPVSPEHRLFYTLEAPSVFFGHTHWQIAASVVFPAGVAALVYALYALATRRDDLGGWPPVEPAHQPVVVAAPTDPVPTAVDGPPVDR